MNKEEIKREIEQYFTEKEIDLLEELTNTNILNLIDYNNLEYNLLQFDLISIEKYIRTEEIRKEIREGIAYIQKNTNKIDVDYNYNITIDNIITIKKDLVNCFCKSNYIDKIPEKIDYTKPLSAFLS